MQQEIDTSVKYSGKLIVKKAEYVYEVVEVLVWKASPIILMIILKEN